MLVRHRPWVLLLAVWLLLTRPDGTPLHVRADSVVAVYAPTVCDPRARAEILLSAGTRLCVRESPAEVRDLL